MTTTLTGVAPTEHASRYLQQLCKHWGHRLEVSFDATRGRVALPGGPLDLEAGPDGLRLVMTSPDPDSAERMRAVVEEHLNRFAHREAPLPLQLERENLMSGPRDIHAYLAEFDDIPGTRVYTARRARAGYQMNQFAMSLMKPANRERFKADEAAYLDEWPLSADQKQAILARDYNRCLDLGGNIYCLAKLFSTDGQSFLQAVGTMTGMSAQDYQAMMVAGGRSPEGLRSIRDGR